MDNSGNNKAIEGVIIPVITPLDENECVDEKAFRAVINHCLNGGVEGIFTGGSAGMGPLLTEKEWKRAMEIAADTVGDQALLIGGVIETSTRRALDRLQFLEKTGFHIFAATPTYYIKLERNDEFFAHFQACREATDMDMIVYNIPSCVASSIPLEVIEKILARNWAQAFKESSGDREYFTRLLEMAGTSVPVLQGNEPDISWGLQLGARGLIPVCGNYEPATFSRAWQAAQNHDIEQLDALQERISFIRESLLIGDKNWISGITYGVTSLGICTETVMRPFRSLPEAEKNRIEALK